MRVAAIVVAWNSAADLPACLGALVAQDHDDLEIVVVDNASTDDTGEVLRAWHARTQRPARVVTNAVNRGFAGGVNDGLATLGDAVDAVLLVNPDARAAPDLVRRCVEVLRTQPDVGSVQPRLTRPAPAATGAAMTASAHTLEARDPSGTPGVLDTAGHVFTTARLWRNRGEGEPDDGRYGDSTEVFGASGALVLHRRTMLDDVAWRCPDGRREVLTEDLFAFFDDVELDWRAQLFGWRCVYEPAARGSHERGGAGPRRTARVEALNYANRLLVIATCDDGRALVRAAPLVVGTTGLKTIELALTEPRALGPGIVRLVRGLPPARRRRRQLAARARRPFADVPAQWAEPFRWRPWFATWWRRVRG